MSQILATQSLWSRVNLASTMLIQPEISGTASVANVACKPLVASAGDVAVIPGWHLQSALKVSSDLPALSSPAADSSSWYRVSSHATVMAGLLENGVYNETTLFYSENMKSVRDILFESPDQQQGSYSGLQYNLTDHIKEGDNCILIRVFPTNYLHDFAMGFVDWNRFPADNGTGVWRNVELSQTGSVSMFPFRILSDVAKSSTETVNITFRTELFNHEPKAHRVKVNGTVTRDGSTRALINNTFDLGSNERKTISVETSIQSPDIWLAARPSGQPLYTIQADIIVEEGQGLVSDRSKSQSFGIRHVSSNLNDYNDTEFTINGEPFQVIGAGYGPVIFMQFNADRVGKLLAYMLDMGMNTLRLEARQEQPELYELADRMGVMILAGWECCDKWEGWEYNEDADGVKWNDSDYSIARNSMLHEAEMMQAHPSMLGFLVGSDFWPDDRATDVYLDALQDMDWPNPILASASMRDYPEALGPSGMKMNDWVPPNYWYGDKEGAAFGFWSELGAGVGTPEMCSLKKFMSDDDLETLWTQPDANLYHMSRYDSEFYNRSIYNKAISSRYGKPVSLDDYVLKCQMADYEATRAQYEAYSTRTNATRPATGLIYWMLNSAWPNLHWQLFDYYLSPMAAYFGTKVGARMEHVAYDYQSQIVWLINHSTKNEGERQVVIDVIDTLGSKLLGTKVNINTAPHSAMQVSSIDVINLIQDIAFLRLVLRDPRSDLDLSRHVYWISQTTDVSDWSQSNFFTTPVIMFANYTKLQSLSAVKVKASLYPARSRFVDDLTHAEVPAFFLRLNAIHASEQAEIVYWSDNYITLWPKEKLCVTVDFKGKLQHTRVEISGQSLEKVTLNGADLQQ
ncbi:uncharacterized protein N7511_003475 [Penicillium nucicola]|uniref:uncharacterized protein n=1 Tax=Penicillium nucicola TaxID=1850975 RepID=UPI0025459F5B|nr:uncharacterized protein N7511_003475 [Penicillium nucicola]KAJ5771424.1 hypothetical protein N7511_003475 [Penicillium nucicola]